MKIKVFIFLIIIFSSHAQAQNCQFNINVGNFVGMINTSVQSIQHSFSLSRGSNSNNCKTFRAYFSKGNAGSYSRETSSGSQIVPYNIYKESNLVNILKDEPDATSGEWIEGTLDNVNVSYNFDFFFKVIDLDSVFNHTASTYHGDQIQIRIFGVKNNGDLVSQSIGYMYVQMATPRFVELSVGGPSSSHDPSQTQHIMSFGNMQSGDIQGASLHIKGNVGFTVRFASEEGSKLVNGGSSVPYSVKVGSTNYKSLTNPGQEYWMFNRSNGTPQNAQTYPVSVKLGTVPNNPQTGNYSDTITISVAAH